MKRSAHNYSSLASCALPITILLTNSYEALHVLSAMAGLFLGVTAPDDIEIRYNKKSKNKKGETIKTSVTFFKHRGESHCLTYWLSCFCLCYIYLFDSGSSIINSFLINLEINVYFASGIFGFFYGGLIHLITDFPNKKGIPILPFGKQYCLKLWKSGQSDTEGLTIFMVFIFSIILSIKVAIINLNLPIKFII